MARRVRRREAGGHWKVRGGWLALGVLNCAKRCGGRRPVALGIAWAYRSRGSGVLVELSRCKPAGPRNPRCASTGGGGDCGDGARGVWLRPRLRFARDGARRAQNFLRYLARQWRFFAQGCPLMSVSGSLFQASSPREDTGRTDSAYTARRQEKEFSYD